MRDKLGLVKPQSKVGNYKNIGSGSSTSHSRNANNAKTF